MSRMFPAVPFERYADDAIVHCRNEGHAKKVLVPNHRGSDRFTQLL